MSKTFLIADDSDDKIELLQSLLLQANWQGSVHIAHTTEEAKQLIDEHPAIGFAFIDYYIPSHNGPAVISYLKEKNPSARIALVSSANNATNNHRAMEAGAEVCICTSHASERVEGVEGEVLGVLEEWKALQGNR